MSNINSLIRNLLIAVMLFCLAAKLNSEASATDLSYLKVIKDCFVREGPASYYKIAENLEIGTIVQFFEKYDNWYLIKTHTGRIGWIAANDVTPLVKSKDRLPKTNFSITDQPNIDLKRSFLFNEEFELPKRGFLWTEPDGSGKIISYLIPGLRVKKLETNGFFLKIQIQNGLIGWVDQNLLTSAEPKLPLPISKAATPKLNLSKIGNLRQEPSLSAPVIKKIPKGMFVVVIDSTDDWYKVKTAEDLTGWLHQSLFFKKSIPNDDSELIVKILRRNGNLRQSPNLTSEVIQEIPAQTVIMVLDSLSDWYQVQLSDDTVGWINKLIFEK